MQFKKVTRIAMKAHPLFHHIELAQHEVDIDEDDGEAKDEVADVAPDGAGGDVSEAVGNVHLHPQVQRLVISRAKQHFRHLLLEHVGVGVNLGYEDMNTIFRNALCSSYTKTHWT